MKKVLALRLAFMLIFSLVTMPASAADAVYGEVIKEIDIDNLDASVNYYTDATKIKDTNLSLSWSSGNVTLYSSSSKNYFGVVDTTSEDKTITKYRLTNATGKETIQDGYAKGENYDLIVGSAMGETYSGTDANTTGRVIKGQPMKGAYLKKVADPKDPANNVLEFNYGQTGETKPTTSYQGVINRIKFGSKEVMFDADTKTITNTGMMAYEWSVYIPENSAKYLNSSGTGYITLGGTVGETKGGYHLLKDMTYYSSSSKKLFYRVYENGDVKVADYEITPDTWHTFKHVIIIDEETVDSTSDLFGYPIVALFIDGELKCKVRARNPLEDAKSPEVRIALAPFSTSKFADLTQNFNVYYDDVKQYWVDEFKVSGIKDAYYGFNPANDSIDVVYSHDADFDALEKAITVKLNGEIAENVSVNIERKDENTATLTFSGLSTAKATTYDVEIAGFKDVYGNTINTAKTFTITTYEAGKLNIAKSDEVIDYEVGTHRAFTLTSELKTDISDVKFLIKNAEGEEVAELIPSANEEGTVFVFDLFGANLNTTGTYTFVTEGVFKEVDGGRINTDIIEIPINVINYNFEGEYRINDNFDGEGIVKDVNWLTGGTKPSGWKYKCMHDDRNSGTYKQDDQGVYMVTECPRCVTIGATLPDNMLTDAFVGIVADPKDETNNVIKYVAGKNGDGNHSIRVYKGNKQEIDVTKNVVMSSKILLTESLKNYMDDYTYNDLPVMSTRGNYEDKFLYAQLETNSNGDLVLTGYNNFKTTLKTDEWFELKYVTMPTTNKVETRDENGNLTAVKYDVWTYMVYINDCLVDVDSKTVFKGVNGTRTENGVTYTGAFATTENTGLYLCGVHFGLYPINNPEVQPTFYVDDVKLYQPDNFVPTVKANGALVTISGNHTFAKNVLDTIKITDTLGNEVDVIGSKEISADKKTITLKLLEDEVAISTDYIIKGVYDSIGQLAKDELTFKTPKSFGIFIDSVTKANTGVNGKVSTYVEIVNTKGEELPVALIVAVYGEECETLGVKCIKLDKLTAEGYKTDVTVDIGENSKEDIKDIKVFLWDSIKTMIPYQLSESIEF